MGFAFGPSVRFALDWTWELVAGRGGLLLFLEMVPRARQGERAPGNKPVGFVSSRSGSSEQLKDFLPFGENKPVQQQTPQTGKGRVIRSRTYRLVHVQTRWSSSRCFHLCWFQQG